MQTTTFLDPQKTAFLVTKKKAVQNGKSTIQFNDKVYSLQPDGTFADRPDGASGAFEQCDVDGQTATFWYLWNGKLIGPVTVAFFMVTQPGS